jgi:hypothetical protein
MPKHLKNRGGAVCHGFKNERLGLLPWLQFSDEPPSRLKGFGDEMLSRTHNSPPALSAPASIERQRGWLQSDSPIVSVRQQCTATQYPHEHRDLVTPSQ